MIVYACLTPGCSFEFIDNLTSAALNFCPLCQGSSFVSPPSAKAGMLRLSVTGLLPAVAMTVIPS